jgi:bla regulator protein blaR1
VTEPLLRMLAWVTIGLTLTLLLRRPARNLFGAGPAFTLWCLPVVLVFAPLLPQKITPAAMVVLPGLTVMPQAMSTMASSTAGIDGAQFLMMMWLAGVAVALGRLAWRYLALLCDMRPAPEAWTSWFAGIAPDIDPRRVRVHAAGPAVVWALPHSRVLLPADFMQRFGDRATCELILNHELVHVRRGDAWWSLAMEIASALLWFHPLMWVARSRFRLDQELACDAASLRALPGQATHYARTLLDSAAVQPAPALIPWLAEPQLKERIAMIARTPAAALRRRFGFIAVAALSACGLLLAGGAAAVPIAAPATSASKPPSVDITYKNRHPPHYPVEATRNGEQGLVVLDVIVNTAGDVAGVHIDQRGTNAPAALQVAAMEAATNWKFNPGRRNGEAVGGTVRIPVTFSLDGFDKYPHTAKPCPAASIYDSTLSKCVRAPNLAPATSA